MASSYQRGYYHSYEEIGTLLKEWHAKYPALCELESRASLAEPPSEGLGETTYARIFFDRRCGAHPQALSAAIERAAGSKCRCAAFSVPVESIGRPDALVAVQVCFAQGA